jgi:predicted Zn-dependent protease
MAIYLCTETELIPYSLGDELSTAKHYMFLVSDEEITFDNMLVQYMGDYNDGNPTSEIIGVKLVTKIQNKFYYTLPWKIVKKITFVNNPVPSGPVPSFSPSYSKTQSISKTKTESPSVSNSLSPYLEEIILESNINNIYDSMETTYLIGSLDGDATSGYNDRTITSIQGVSGISGLTLSSNQITLTETGRFYIKATSNAYMSKHFKTAINFISGDYSGQRFEGATRYTYDESISNSYSESVAIVDITEDTVLKIETWVEKSKVGGFNIAGESTLFVQKIASTSTTSSTTMIAPDAIGLLTSDASGSGTGLTWTRSESDYTITLSSSQSDTNYQIITDAQTFDDKFVQINSKSVSNFTLSVYDSNGDATLDSTGINVLVYASDPVKTIEASAPVPTPTQTKTPSASLTLPGEFTSSNKLFNYDIRNTSGDSTYDADVYKQPIHDAFARWEEVITSAPYSGWNLYVDIDYASLDASLLGDASITAMNSTDGSNDFGKTFSTNGTFQLNVLYLDSMLGTTDSEGNTEMYYVALHEIGHLLGIGKISFVDATINSKPVVEYTDEDDGLTKKYYNGANGLAKYKEYFPEYTDFLIGIPIEDSGDSNTKDINFEEGDMTLEGDFTPISSNDRMIDGQFHPGLGNELMTAWTVGVYPLPLSKITIGVLDDMGFSVNYDSADNFVPPEVNFYFTSPNKTFFYQIENTSGNPEYDDISYMQPIHDSFNKWDEVISGKPWVDYDLVIYVGYSALEDGVLGGATPTTISTLSSEFSFGTTFATAGYFQLNTSYLTSMRDNVVDEATNTTQLFTTALHEIGHIIGIGPLTFSSSSITSKPVVAYIDGLDSTTKYYYTGANALQYYKYYYPSYASGLVGIPIEDDGGGGTAMGHPEEGTMGTTSENDRYINGKFHPGLQHELMTGWSDSGKYLPMSKITLGFLNDIGYGVDYDKADDFTPINPTPVPYPTPSKTATLTSQTPTPSKTQSYTKSYTQSKTKTSTSQNPITPTKTQSPTQSVSSTRTLSISSTGNPGLKYDSKTGLYTLDLNKITSECSCDGHLAVKLNDFREQVYKLANLRKNTK